MHKLKTFGSHFAYSISNSHVIRFRCGSAKFSPLDCETTYRRSSPIFERFYDQIDFFTFILPVFDCNCLVSSSLLPIPFFFAF